MSKNWKWFLPGYVFALPGTIIGLVLLVFYGCSELRWKDGVLNVVIKRQQLIGGPWVAGQTFGNIVFYRDKMMLGSPVLRVHEYRHVWQAMVFTWVLMAAWYGIQFVIGRIRYDYYKAYRNLDWEQDARHAAQTIEPGEWGSWT